MLVRIATPNDLSLIAAFHVEIWRQTYRELAPRAAYDALDQARRETYWKEKLTPDCGQSTLLALKNNQVAGLVSHGPASHPAFGKDHEIKHLYVAQTHSRNGLGRELMSRVFAAAPQGAIALAVVRENTAARAFYARLGGVETGEFRDPGPLWQSDNVIVRWPAGWQEKRPIN